MAIIKDMFNSHTIATNISHNSLARLCITTNTMLELAMDTMVQLLETWRIALASIHLTVLPITITTIT
jgi:hypothetical protein